MTRRYNHAFTLAYEVISTDPHGATTAEHLEALKARLNTLLTDPGEAEEALQVDAPFDTYVVGGGSIHDEDEDDEETDQRAGL